MKHVRIGTAEVLKVRWNGVRNMVGGGERGSEPPLRAERRGGARRLGSSASGNTAYGFVHLLTNTSAKAIL